MTSRSEVNLFAYAVVLSFVERVLFGTLALALSSVWMFAVLVVVDHSGRVISTWRGQGV